jgi:hypothetical protein
MDVAALIAWVITALGGFVLLGTRISRGGTRQGDAGASRFPPELIFGHFLMAATGLVLWILYLAADSAALAWVSFAILVVVALLGFTMAARWLQDRRGPVSARPSSTSPSRWSSCTGCWPPPPSSWCCWRRSAPPDPPRRRPLR